MKKTNQVKKMFEKLEGQKKEIIMEKLQSVISGAQVNTPHAVLIQKALSFYPEYTFLEITDGIAVPPLKKYFLYDTKEQVHFVALDHSNKPFYDLNDKGKLALSAGTILSYVRFFFEHVSSKYGPYQLIEEVDDIIWQEDLPPAARRAMEQLIQPLQISEQENEVYTLSAHFIFQKSLFSADIYVDAAGRVNITNQTLLIDDLAVRDILLG